VFTYNLLLGKPISFNHLFKRNSSYSITKNSLIHLIFPLFNSQFLIQNNSSPSHHSSTPNQQHSDCAWKRKSNILQQNQEEQDFVEETNNGRRSKRQKKSDVSRDNNSNNLNNNTMSPTIKTNVAEQTLQQITQQSTLTNEKLEIEKFRVNPENISLRALGLIQFCFKDNSLVKCLKKIGIKKNEPNLVRLEMISNSNLHLGELELRLVEHEKEKHDFRLVEFCAKGDCQSKCKTQKVIDVKETKIQRQEDGLFDILVSMNEQCAHSISYNGGVGKSYFCLQITSKFNSPSTYSSNFLSHDFKVVAAGKGEKRETRLSFSKLGVKAIPRKMPQNLQNQPTQSSSEINETNQNQNQPQIKEKEKEKELTTTMTILVKKEKEKGKEKEKETFEQAILSLDPLKLCSMIFQMQKEMSLLTQRVQYLESQQSTSTPHQIVSSKNNIV